MRPSCLRHALAFPGGLLRARSLRVIRMIEHAICRVGVSFLAILFILPLRDDKAHLALATAASLLDADALVGEQPAHGVGQGALAHLGDLCLALLGEQVRGIAGADARAHAAAFEREAHEQRE